MNTELVCFSNSICFGDHLTVLRIRLSVYGSDADCCSSYVLSSLTFVDYRCEGSELTADSGVAA